MKLSEWVEQLAGELQANGDRELLEMPSHWLSDAVPDELARWLLENGWVNVTLLPEGVLVPGLLNEDPRDDQLEQLGERIEVAVMAHADDAADRSAIVAALRRALRALGE
jgi:hypothetical protein